jgi:tRNA(Ile)-lysidine synthase
MHSLLQAFHRSWPAQRWKDVTILLAVSGGPDSVALAHAVGQMATQGRGRAILAHFNHNTRGQASQDDADFVQQLALELGFSAVIESRPTGAPDDEASLREDRYRFLHQQARRLGARYVATGHSADDVVETLLLQLFRGTGLAGLAALPPFREFSIGDDLILVRPMLEVRRDQVLDYLASRHAAYRVDASNEDPKYARNWLRHCGIPFLCDRFGPAMPENLLRTAQSLREVQQWLENQAMQHEDRWLRCDRIREQISIAIQPPNSLDWPVMHCALRRGWQMMKWPLQAMTMPHWSLLRGLVYSESAEDRVHPQMLPGQLQCSIQGPWVRVARIKANGLIP